MDLEILKKRTEPIFFVTNDVSRAIGLENILPNYHIICLDDHPLVDLLQKAGVSVFCLEKELSEKNVLKRSSGLILEHPLTLAFIKKKSLNQTPNILFFKPQKKIEILAQKYGFNLIGNSSKLNGCFEDKLNFFRLFGKELPLPPTQIVKLSELNFYEFSQKYGLPLVIQFGYGWAGSSTFFVSSSADFEKIKKDYPNIEVKAGKYIKGCTVLNNAVVWPGKVLQSGPALQINADKLLTANPGGTGGRQWPAKISIAQKESIRKITEKIGNFMDKAGYRGFFGLDFLIEKDTEKVWVSENNARLTASSSFYTKLELSRGCFPLLGFHLLSFLQPQIDIANTGDVFEIMGCEVVAKNTEKYPVKVNANLKVGVFDKKINFKKAAYFFDKLNKDEFWMTCANYGREVNPEIELIRINSLTEMCNDDGKLKDGTMEILQKVLRSLKLAMVDENK